MPKKLSLKMIMIFFLIFFELIVNIMASHFAIEVQFNHITINEFLERQRILIKDITTDKILIEELKYNQDYQDEGDYNYLMKTSSAKINFIDSMFRDLNEGIFKIDQQEFIISLDPDFEKELIIEFEKASIAWNVLKESISDLDMKSNTKEEMKEKLFRIRQKERALVYIEDKISKMCKDEMIKIEDNVKMIQKISMISGIIVFFIMIYIMIRGLYMPIKELQRLLKEMSSGNLKNRMILRDKDEFSILYQDLNVFLDTMERLFDLEDKIILENNLDTILMYINQNFKEFIRFDTVGISFRAKEHEGIVRKVKESSIIESKIENMDKYLIDKMTIEKNMIKMPIIIDKSNLGFVFFVFKNQEDIKEDYISFLKLIKNKLSIAFYKSLLSRDLLSIVTDSLANLSEGRDNETGMHLKRMAKYSKIIASKLYEKGLFKDDIDKSFIDIIKITAPMHDIGKVSIPDSILLKPGKLTKEEFDTMKTHTNEGKRVLNNLNNEFSKYNIEYFKMAEDISAFHHEKFDGSGYPSGIKEDQIPLCARICAVADVFDALTSKRPYKRAFTIEESCQILRESSGSHFDPIVLDAFFESLDEIELVYEKFSDKLEIPA